MNMTTGYNRFRLLVYSDENLGQWETYSGHYDKEWVWSFFDGYCFISILSVNDDADAQDGS
jgi:hypothetical protein